MSEILRILERTRSTIIPGLDRMKQAMLELGMTEQSLPPAIVIGGTNGKGSTSGILWRLLSLRGLRCGLYTSPHVISFHERIQSSHKHFTLEYLNQELEALRSQLSLALYEALTFFEITTLLALYVFQRNECELIILEVGLGGRWDACNAVDAKASAIVSIDFDHQEWLGNTLQEIAGEKLGIARRGRPLFWGDLLYSQDLQGTLDQAQKQLAFELYKVGESFAWDEEEGKAWVRMDVQERFEYSMPHILNTRAEVFKNNFALAFSLYVWVLKKIPFAGRSVENIDAQVFQDDLHRFSADIPPWPFSFLGRMQRMQVKAHTKTWDFYLDVCHNVASVRECVRTLQSAGLLASGKKLAGFVSILRDKDLEPMLDVLNEVFDPFAVFKIEHERSITEERLNGYKDLTLYDKFADVWEEFADRISSPVVICGSFYAVGKVIEYFGAYPRTYTGQSVLYSDDPRGLQPQSKCTV